MLLAWTTVATPEDAARLARGAVEAGLAACVQVEGPVASHYRWEGRLETAQEYRLLFKFLPEQAGALETWIHARHPYDTPEWIVVRAEHVSGKYLSWARGTSTPAPFPPPPSFRLISVMSQHKSLQSAKGVAVKRNVLKRFERVELLKKRGQWKEGERIVGLRKTKPEV